MLQPTTRLTLIDAMRPPAGYVFDEAMAVTFTLDLRALLAAPAAFVFARTVEVDGSDGTEGHAEPIELIHAIRTYAGRITVFSQAGEIALPPSRRVFSFLEGSVVAVTAPRGGVVHPKVWVLRYVDPDETEPAQLRVLVASRNLTFDTSWDTVLRLDTTDANDTGPAATMGPIADLFDALTQRAVGQLADVHQDRVGSLGAALRERRFALPAGVEQLDVHVLGLAAGPAPFPDDADRSMVISPFVSDDFFARVHPGGVDELVSRVEHLSALSPEALADVAEAYAFDDGSTPDLEDPDGVAASDPARPLQGLHAKVFAFESGRTARLFCGSANATAAAFGANLEVLVELTGPTDLLGIDAMCDGTGDELGLRALFVPYRPSTEPPEATTEDPLASVRRAIGRLELTGDVEPSGSGWAVTYRSRGSLPDRPELSIWCWPLTSPGNRRQVEPGQSLKARFETSLEGISGFLVVEITDEAGLLTHSLLPAALRGVPEERDRQLLRSLVGSADRFLRYLLALLSDGPEDLGLLDVLDRATDDHSATDQRSTTALPVLEHLVRTLRRDPARLAAIDPLVTDLAADDALPPGFADLWRQLQVVAAQRGRA